ncbi:hypothetical protein KI387_039454, partial [Taxus chinensis]
IQLGLMGVGVEGIEEEMGVKGEATVEASGKYVETLGGGIDKESNAPLLVGPGVTTGEEKDMEMEGICNWMEGILGDRSTREEKMEEVGDGREEGRGEDTSIGIDA